MSRTGGGVRWRTREGEREGGRTLTTGGPAEKSWARLTMTLKCVTVALIAPSPTTGPRRAAQTGICPAETYEMSYSMEYGQGGGRTEHLDHCLEPSQWRDVRPAHLEVGLDTPTPTTPIQQPNHRYPQPQRALLRPEALHMHRLRSLRQHRA
jgi:hypothetical protein